MKNRLFFYATRELRMKKKAALSIFSIMLICMFVLVNIYLFSYGSHLAFVKEQNDNYHIRLTELNQTEADAIFSLDYIESVRTVKRSDGIIAYIFLKNDDPVLLKSQCVQLIRDIFPSDRAAELTSRAALLINRQYYELAITPHFIRILPTYFLLFLLSCLSICFALQVKNIRSAKEYGYMLALGLRKRGILGITLLQIFMLLFVSYLIALAAGIPLLKLICIFTEYAYKGYYTSVVLTAPLIQQGNPIDKGCLMCYDETSQRTIKLQFFIPQSGRY